MALIDTSSWTHALRRKGDPVIRGRVDQLLATRQAAWCDMVRVELWAGAESDWDRKVLQNMEDELPTLETTAEVWDKACFVGRLARGKGLTVPNTDLIIFACAIVHDVALEHNDQHFVKLQKLVADTHGKSHG